MRGGAAKKKAARALPNRPRQVNVRVERALYQALEVVALQERRSMPQAARQLMEEGLRHRAGGGTMIDDTAAHAIAGLAAAGGSFDWLADEPDLYDDTSGEPV